MDDEWRKLLLSETKECRRDIQRLRDEMALMNTRLHGFGIKLSFIMVFISAVTSTVVVAIKKKITGFF